MLTATILFGQKTATIHYAFRNFTGLNASSGFEITVEKGEQYAIEVTVDAKYVEQIKVFVEDNTLFLSEERHSRNKTLQAHITVPELSNINLSQGCELKSASMFETENFKAIISGGSEMDFKIHANKADINMSGGSDVTLYIETEQLTLTASGAADAKLQGKATYTNISASGGSDVSARNLKTIETEVKSSGASEVEVDVEKKLTASASGASNVVYDGNPLVNIKSSGASDIRKRK
jgi:hypothetical protein